MMLNNKEWPRQVKCVDIPRLVCAGMWLGRVPASCVLYSLGLRDN